MGKPESLSRKLGLTRGKAALIAILAVALVAVLYIQYGRSGEDDVAPLAAEYRQLTSASSSPAAAAATAATTAGAAVRTDARRNAAVDQAKWKTPDLATVVAFDPFAVPASFPKSEQITAAIDGEGEAGLSDPAVAAEQLTDAIEQLRLELQELQQRGVHVIVKQRDQYVAMIGDRTVHVGDEIGGFTITAIEPDHVRVERKVQK